MASLTYPWLPVGLLLTQKFDSMSKMAKVKMPVLIVHGAADRFVPSRFSEQLYEAAPAPKKLLLIDGGTHNNSMRTGAVEYRHALDELFGLGGAGVAGALRAQRRLNRRTAASGFCASALAELGDFFTSAASNSTWTSDRPPRAHRDPSPRQRAEACRR